MEAFAITLREGVEAALVVGLVVTYLNRTGRGALRAWVYAGMALAAATSLAGGIALMRAGLDPDNPASEGALMAVAALLVISLVAWMWRSSRGLGLRIQSRLEPLSATAVSDRRAGWGLLGFAFFMILREGVEMVLFLAALSLARAPDAAGLLGGLIGLGLAAVFGVLFVKGSLRINLRRFFAATGIVLFVLAVRLAAGSLHEFWEAGLLPAVPALEPIVDAVAGEGGATLILIALILLPVASMLPDLRLAPAEPAHGSKGAESGTGRGLAAMYRARQWQMALMGVTLITVFLLAAVSFLFSGSAACAVC